MQKSHCIIKNCESTIYLGAAKAPFSVLSDSNKNAASVVFIKFILFPGITGSISNSGQAEININLSSIDTNIPIRDQRLKALFFKVAKFPQATIKATIDMKKIKSIRYYKRMEIPAILEFYGVSKEIKLEVLIAKVYKKKLLITSMKPIIINAKDYGVPAKNLVALSKTVGGLSLSEEVAVNFVLSFADKQ
jgi:polyisoprenoid-binding protein YceI